MFIEMPHREELVPSGAAFGKEIPDILTRFASMNQCQPGLARQRLAVRWLRSEGTHRFPLDLEGPSKAVSALFSTSHRTPKPRGNSDGSGAGRTSGCPSVNLPRREMPMPWKPFSLSHRQRSGVRGRREFNFQRASNRIPVAKPPTMSVVFRTRQL